MLLDSILNGNPKAIISTETLRIKECFFGDYV